MSLQPQLDGLRSLIEQKKGQRIQLNKLYKEADQEEAVHIKRAEHTRQAQTVVQQVARMTQEELQFHFSELVSLALATVFDDPYKFRLEFVLRRDRSEADLFLERGEEKVHPMSAAGGGVVDVAAFALRVAMWCMQQPRSRATLILDEPFRFLSRDLQDRAALMIKEISQRLNLQIIMVTHNNELIDSADAFFQTHLSNGQTIITKGETHEIKSKFVGDHPTNTEDQEQKQPPVDGNLATGVQARATRRVRSNATDHPKRQDHQPAERATGQVRHRRG
jgi:DNA repair exonuclease SbcCD ATPase subunit